MPTRSGLLGLWASEARQKGVTLLAGVVLVVLLEVLIAWRVQTPQLRVLISLVVAGVPALYWLFGGFGAFVGRLPDGPPRHHGPLSQGLTLVLAKYLWLLFELLVLGGALVASALYFLDGLLPLDEIGVSTAARLNLALLIGSTLLAPPAIAVAAGVVGRASRWPGLAGLAAFALLWWAYLLLAAAVSSTNLLGSLTLSFLSLPVELCPGGQDCYIRANGAFVAFQPLFAAIVLGVAGRTLDHLRHQD